jgi:ribonuclease G
MNTRPDLPADLLISRTPGEARWALREAGDVVELGVERARAGAQPGDLFLGRVRAVVASANAAFVDLDGAQQGFLSGREARRKVALTDGPASPQAESDDIARLVTEGEAVLVQVKRAALGDKAAQVTAALTLAGLHLVLTPGWPDIVVSRRIADADEHARLTALATGLRGGLTAGLAGGLSEEDGLIVRTAAAGAGAAVLEAEAGRLAARWQTLREAARKATAPAALAAAEAPLLRVLRDHAGPALERIVVDDHAALAAVRRWLREFAPSLAERAEAVVATPPLFAAEGVDEAFDAGLAREVAFAAGGSLIIEPTAALIAIDVNTGGRAGRQGRAILETNLAAAAAVAGQIRLRNLGGLIAVDFVRMRDRGDRERVLEALRAALAVAAPDAQLGGFTRFGLVEIVRPRGRAALHEALCAPSPDGGWRRSAETLALEALRAARAAAAAHPGRALTLRAGAAVIAQLAGPLKPAHEETQAALGLALALQDEPGFDDEAFDISPD